MTAFTRLALLPLLLGGLLATAANANQSLLLLVRETMQQGINAATMEIWDVGNNAMGDDGGIDPAQMTPEKWTQLETSAQRLKALALSMHDAEGFLAASSENTPDESEPGAVSMKDVQRYIDADPDGFRAAALALAEHAGLIADAAKARDTAAAGDLVGQLDQVCEACHATYWYPEQQ